MSYLYELHCHTRESSTCAGGQAKQLVESYKEIGYTGLFITDHFFNSNCNTSYSKSWENKVDDLMRGYNIAKDHSTKYNDFDVFFGFEYTNDYGGDFLIYGIDRDYLIDTNGYILEWSFDECMLRLRDSGAYIIHAHPFRRMNYIKAYTLCPWLIDGVEICNANSDNGRINPLSENYALTNNLKKFVGSDMHGIPSTLYNLGRPLCNMQSENKIVDINNFKMLARMGNLKPNIIKKENIT